MVFKVVFQTKFDALSQICKHRINVHAIKKSRFLFREPNIMRKCIKRFILIKQVKVTLNVDAQYTFDP